MGCWLNKMASDIFSLNSSPANLMTRHVRRHPHLSTAERTASIGEEKGPGQRWRACMCVRREREGVIERRSDSVLERERETEGDVELNGSAGAAGALCVRRWWRLELMAAALLLRLRTTAPNFTECSTSLKRTGLDRQQGFLEESVCVCVCAIRLGARLTGAWWKAVLIGHWLSLRGVVHSGTDKPEAFLSLQHTLESRNRI